MTSGPWVPVTSQSSFGARFDEPVGGSIGNPGAILVGSDDGPGIRSKWFFSVGAGVLTFHVNGSGIGPQFFPRAPFQPEVGRWYHLAVTRRVDEFTLYIDGVEQVSETRGITIPNASAALTIGQAEGIGFMHGAIDELSFYRRSLSPTELGSIFGAGRQGKCRPVRVLPTQGGNSGWTSVRISGLRVPDTAVRVRLTAVNQADILSTTATATDRIEVAFNLLRAPPGLRDVVIETRTATVAVLPAAFEVIEGGQPRIWMDIVGLQTIRVREPRAYFLVIGNAGNVDAGLTEVSIAIPPQLTVTATAHSALPFASAPTIREGFGVMLPRIRAGQTANIPMSITPQQTGDFALTGVIIGGAAVRATIGTGIPLDNFDRYPAYWPPGRGPPPSGYIVFWDEYGGTDSVGWSLGPDNNGVGRVAHQITPRGGGPDGLQIHVWDQPPPFMAVRPPGWSLSEAQARRDDFLSRYRIEMENGLPVAYFNDQRIEYNREGGRFPPKGNCGDFVNFIAPEVGQLDDADRYTRYIPIQIYDRLQKYWSDLGMSSTSFEWPDRPTIWETLNAEHPQLGPFWDFLRKILSRGSLDPNEKVGRFGFGPDRYLGEGEPLHYTIFFENLSTATAPARTVTIRDDLDLMGIEPSSLEFTEVRIANLSYTLTPGQNVSSGRFDLRPVIDATVKVEATFDRKLGTLLWSFATLDSETGLPPEDPLAGFLPPNIASPIGEGSVSFTVLPRKDLTTGDAISNSASIVFDQNEAIETQVWSNAVDKTPPTSSMNPLAETSPSPLEISWSGVDEGSGIAWFEVYVSEDDGDFELLLARTAATSTVFEGTVGRRYRFFTQAVDGVGLKESPPAQADVSVFVVERSVPDVGAVAPDATVADSGVVAAPTSDGGCSCRVDERRRGNMSAAIVLMLALTVLRRGSRRYLSGAECRRAKN